MTDYRALLKHYMAHVIDCESISFVEQGSYDPRLTFSAEERAELRKIEEEVRAEFVP